jgi:hypothetical protein
MEIRLLGPMLIPRRRAATRTGTVCTAGRELPRAAVACLRWTFVIGLSSEGIEEVGPGLYADAHAIRTAMPG